MTAIKNTKIDKSLDDIRKELYANIGRYQQDEKLLPRQLSLFDGVVRGIIELTAWGLFQLYKFLNHKLVQAFPHLSTGKDLLRHCESVGITPKPPSKTRGKVKIFRDDPAGNQTIRAGQIFKTETDHNGKEYRFITVKETICLDGEAHTTLEVEAEFPGRAYNVPVGFITEIVNPLNKLDTVINDSNWITSEGHDEESEDSLRKRYILQWKASSGLNGAYYEQIARSVDGVVDVFIDDQHPDKDATVHVIIRGEKGPPPPKVIENVQTAIDAGFRQFDHVTAMGIDIQEQPLELQLRLTTGDKDEIEATKKEVEKRLWALNDPFSKIEGVSPLKIRQTLTMDTLIVAAKINHVNKIVWTTPEEDVPVKEPDTDDKAKRTLISISSITVTTEVISS